MKAEEIVQALVTHYSKIEKFESIFPFPKRTLMTTKLKVIELLKENGIDASFNQIFHRETSKLVQDTTAILIGRE